MDKQNEIRTTFLTYNVIGKECPNGITKENCQLRKKLAELKDEIGYIVLENGNLVVPEWTSIGKKWERQSFRLKDIMSVCHECWLKNHKKKQKNPEEYENLPYIQTVIYAYQLSGVNCPENMNCDNCPTRKMLRDTEQKHHIGYKELSKNVLLIPKEHYNSKTNIYNDISQRASDICTKCFEKSRQK